MQGSSGKQSKLINMLKSRNKTQASKPQSQAIITSIKQQSGQDQTEAKITQSQLNWCISIIVGMREF